MLSFCVQSICQALLMLLSSKPRMLLPQQEVKFQKKKGRGKEANSIRSSTTLSSQPLFLSSLFAFRLIDCQWIPDRRHLVQRLVVHPFRPQVFVSTRNRLLRTMQGQQLLQERLPHRGKRREIESRKPHIHLPKSVKLKCKRYERLLAKCRRM